MNVEKVIGHMISEFQRSEIKPRRNKYTMSIGIEKHAKKSLYSPAFLDDDHFRVSDLQ